VTGGTDGSLVLWNRLAFANIAFCHDAEVVDICISPRFSIVASCSLDNSVAVIILPELVCLRRIKLKMDRPRRILFCETIGMVVVTSERELESYMIDGTFVASATIDSGIEDACVVSTQNGRDYLAIVNSIGQLVLYDSFTFKKLDVLCNAEGLTKVYFSVFLSSLIVTSTDFTIRMITFE
jgi:WD40 repeat protein